MTPTPKTSPADGERPGAGADASELQVIRERLELAAEAAQLGIWDLDLGTGALFVSDIARAICGLAPDESLTLDAFLAVTHPQDLDALKERLAAALGGHASGPRPPASEHRIVRPDGEVRCVLAQGKAIFDGPRAVRYVGSLQDVTERRRLEAQDRSFAERLRFAMRAGGLGSFDYDMRTGAVSWDAAQLEIFGLTPETAPRTPEETWMRVHPDDRPRLMAAAASALRTGETYHAEYRALRPDGEIRWCAGSASVETDAAGEATRIFGYNLDITGRKNAERADAERRALLEGVLDTPELGVGVIELEGESFRFALLNPTAARNYGVPVDSFDIDAAETPTATPEVVRRWAEILRRIWESGRARTMEYGSSTKEPPTFSLATYTPLPSGPSGRPRLAFVSIDITAKKLAEERQQLLMREVDHRARNALAVAQAVLQLTPAAEAAAFKAAVAGRINAIARAHSLLAADRWTGVDLCQLLREELAPYDPDGIGRATLAGEPYALPPTMAQSVGLVLHELATNAAKYGALSAPAGRLTVAWSCAGSALEIAWTETTPAEAARPRPRRKGFGMSLLERTISGQLGGTWRADWRPEGLAFTMRLPVEETAEPLRLMV